MTYDVWYDCCWGGTYGLCLIRLFSRLKDNFWMLTPIFWMMEPKMLVMTPTNQRGLESLPLSSPQPLLSLSSTSSTLQDTLLTVRVGVSVRVRVECSIRVRVVVVGFGLGDTCWHPSSFVHLQHKMPLHEFSSMSWLVHIVLGSVVLLEPKMVKDAHATIVNRTNVLF
jgi:hypothetical protein